MRPSRLLAATTIFSVFAFSCGDDNKSNNSGQNSRQTAQGSLPNVVNSLDEQGFRAGSIELRKNIRKSSQRFGGVSNGFTSFAKSTTYGRGGSQRDISVPSYSGSPCQDIRKIYSDAIEQMNQIIADGLDPIFDEESLKQAGFKKDQLRENEAVAYILAIDGNESQYADSEYEDSFGGYRQPEPENATQEIRISGSGNDDEIVLYVEMRIVATSEQGSSEVVFSNGIYGNKKTEEYKVAYNITVNAPEVSMLMSQLLGLTGGAEPEMVIDTNFSLQNEEAPSSGQLKVTMKLVDDATIKISGEGNVNGEQANFSLTKKVGGRGSSCFSESESSSDFEEDDPFPGFG